MTDIFKINDCPVAKLSENRNDFETFTHILPNKQIEQLDKLVKNFNILHGENVYFYGSNNNKNTASILKFLSTCNADKKIYINVTVAEKNKPYLLNYDNIEMFTAEIMDNPETARRIVTQAIERAKRIMESGETVIVAIDDVLSVSCVDENNLNLTKSILSLTKNSQQGAISIFAVMSSEKHLSIFEKLADKRINIDEEL